MRAVHLGMVELERQLQRCSEKPLAVFSSDEEGVVENATVHADGSVDLGVHNGGGADHHAVGQVVVFAGFRRLPRQAQVVGTELRQVSGKGHVAGADLAGLVPDDGVHGQGVILQQLPPHGKRIELPDPTGGFSDAPAQQHVEFESFSAAEAGKGRYIHRFEERYHGVWRVHPQFIGFCPGGGFRIKADGLHRMASSAWISPD